MIYGACLILVWALYERKIKILIIRTLKVLIGFSHRMLIHTILNQKSFLKFTEQLHQVYFLKNKIIFTSKY